MNTNPLQATARMGSPRTTGVAAITPVLLVQLVGIVAFIAVAAHLLYWVYPQLFAPVLLFDELAKLKAGLSKEVSPKPEERFVFLSLCVLVPLVAWATGQRMTAQCRWNGRSAENAGLAVRLSRDFFLAGMAWALVYPFLNVGFVALLLGRDEIAWFPEPETIGITCVAALVSWAAIGIHTTRQRPLRTAVPWLRGAKAKHVCCWLFLSVLLLSILAWRIFGVSGAGFGQAWYVSLDAVLYALSQVVRGKTLLVDLPSQYGLFPEFLAPLFRFAGLSVFKVSLVFAGLQVLSLAALFAVMARFIKEPLWLLLGSFALVTVMYGNCLHFGGSQDVYFQYGPVRVIWPAVSVWAFMRFASSRTLAASARCSCVAAIGILWNVESGLAISIAFCGVLFFRWLGAMTRRTGIGTQGFGWAPVDYGRALLLHVAMLLLVGMVFFTWIGMKADGPLDLRGMVLYQSIFYRIGFMMLPLPLYPHPWMSILVVYLLGLMYAYSKWSQDRAGVRADVVGYLSLLGVALFIYYEGRSHLLVLLAVCWPAVIVLSLLLDEVVRMLQNNLLPMTYRVLPAAGATLLLLGAGSLVYHVPLLAREAYSQWANAGSFANPVVRDEIHFIEANSRPGDVCLILARRQAMYYTEANLVSPVQGPGLIETLARADDERLGAAIDRGTLPCLFVGVGENSQLGPDRSIEQWRSIYRVAHTSPGGTMLHLLPLQTALH